MDNINQPSHYNQGVECITFTRHLMFQPGNVFKYIYRESAKNGLEDLKKALVYASFESNDHSYSQPLPYVTYRSLLQLLGLVNLDGSLVDKRMRVLEHILYAAYIGQFNEGYSKTWVEIQEMIKELIYLKEHIR